MSKITLVEEASTPSTPAAGKWTIYTRPDGLYIVDDAGNVTGPLAGGMPKGQLYGLTLSNNGTDPTNDIDIAAGECRSSDDAADLVLASALTKRLDASWAVGTNQGGLDTGSIGNNTYHVWLIKRSDTGVVDALFSTSASSPTMPTNYDYKRRIGSIIRSGGAILGFVQDADTFMLKSPVNNVNTTNPGTGAVTRTVTVPSGIRVEAILSVAAYVNGGTAADMAGNIYISDLSLDDITPGLTTGLNFIHYTNATVMQAGGIVNVFTNTSAQVRSKISQSTANTNFYMNTHGWIDRRGRLS